MTEPEPPLVTLDVEPPPLVRPTSPMILLLWTGVTFIASTLFALGEAVITADWTLVGSDWRRWAASVGLSAVVGGVRATLPAIKRLLAKAPPELRA